jgi:ABC-type transport system involved in cytochrome bd biosynthesis fused ATPase/permease subunit
MKVIGGVGSGKTSLLSGILGEMYKLNGNINTNGLIAYVAQEPWIQNTSIKGNIVFEKPFKEKFYKQVLDACQLVPELRKLTAGESTLIWDKCVNISRRQKQQVSLARAVYSSANIYIMDDPLSSLDSQAGKQIFDRVIGPNGMLNTKVSHISRNQRIKYTNLFYI